MSTSKKKRDEAKLRLPRKLGPRSKQSAPSSPIFAGSGKPDIRREISYIIKLAQSEDSRIVTLGKLVLFSTRTRDAWLLDREDDLALCLCRDGEPQPFKVIDTPDTFGIEWPAGFAIEEAAFIVREQSGRLVVIHGYPTAEISAACRG